MQLREHTIAVRWRLGPEPRLLTPEDAATRTEATREESDPMWGRPIL